MTKPLPPEKRGLKPRGEGNRLGRRPGTPNKFTKTAKEAIELAFQGVGGVDALISWAMDNPGEFYTKIYPKLLPLQVNANIEATVRAVTRVELVAPSLTAPNVNG